jgi:hypothetical protein
MRSAWTQFDRVHCRLDANSSALLDAYVGSEDTQARLTLLSTWLGDVHLGSTYWCSRAAPELMHSPVRDSCVGG